MCERRRNTWGKSIRWEVDGGLSSKFRQWGKRRLGVETPTKKPFEPTILGGKGWVKGCKIIRLCRAIAVRNLKFKSDGELRW